MNLFTWPTFPLSRFSPPSLHFTQSYVAYSLFFFLRLLLLHLTPPLLYLQFQPLAFSYLHPDLLPANRWYLTSPPLCPLRTLASCFGFFSPYNSLAGLTPVVVWGVDLYAESDFCSPFCLCLLQLVPLELVPIRSTDRSLHGYVGMVVVITGRMVAPGVTSWHQGISYCSCNCN